jgi:hypothetical protein
MDSFCASAFHPEIFNNESLSLFLHLLSITCFVNSANWDGFLFFSDCLPGNSLSEFLFPGYEFDYDREEPLWRRADTEIVGDGGLSLPLVMVMSDIHCGLISHESCMEHERWPVSLGNVSPTTLCCFTVSRQLSPISSAARHSIQKAFVYNLSPGHGTSSGIRGESFTLWAWHIAPSDRFSLKRYLSVTSRHIDGPFMDWKRETNRKELTSLMTLVASVRTKTSTAIQGKSIPFIAPMKSKKASFGDNFVSCLLIPRHLLTWTSDCSWDATSRWLLEMLCCGFSALTEAVHDWSVSVPETPQYPSLRSLDTGNCSSPTLRVRVLYIHRQPNMSQWWSWKCFGFKSFAMNSRARFWLRKGVCDMRNLVTREFQLSSECPSASTVISETLPIQLVTMNCPAQIRFLRVNCNLWNILSEWFQLSSEYKYNPMLMIKVLVI